MTYQWVIVLALGVTALTLRVVVPLAAGGRELPAWLRNALTCATPALMAGLVVTLLWPASGDVSSMRTLTALAGVGVGVALLAAKRSILTAMIGAAVVSALLRLVLG
ncbi:MULTISPECIES: AzlD domain-containing protein [unclassified Amycolatopsis]|uniref:AzlD domain-containing protein n=1 Tax=unclassified Amycolatopsis TaxID=2618356 RepID=UPI002E128BED|nr:MULTISPECIES: AzlD domain-containing protein [unclassified Amycolatopsis]WSJ80964.1 AzlD domain-containing protein [Amycolatopsis sp. NBC_01307]WSK75598.1 AzlD domain-containing protein [Amycolatopsis sp. NBC_01286]